MFGTYWARTIPVAFLSTSGLIALLEWKEQALLGDNINLNLPFRCIFCIGVIWTLQWETWIPVETFKIVCPVEILEMPLVGGKEVM